MNPCCRRNARVRQVSSILDDGTSRVVIEGVESEIDGGLFPIKRSPGETVAFEADICGDGIIYDAALDCRFEAALLEAVSRRRTFPGQSFEILAVPSKCLRSLKGRSDSTSEPAPTSKEQCNASIRYGERFHCAVDRKITAMRIPYYSDYHLGKLLCTGKDFVVIDFGGVAGSAARRAAGEALGIGGCCGNVAIDRLQGDPRSKNR